jgi:hypothetical protein
MTLSKDGFILGETFLPKKFEDEKYIYVHKSMFSSEAFDEISNTLKKTVYDAGNLFTDKYFNKSPYRWELFVDFLSENPDNSDYIPIKIYVSDAFNVENTIHNSAFHNQSVM